MKDYYDGIQWIVDKNEPEHEYLTVAYIANYYGKPIASVIADIRAIRTGFKAPYSELKDMEIDPADCYEDPRCYDKE